MWTRTDPGSLGAENTSPKKLTLLVANLWLVASRKREAVSVSEPNSAFVHSLAEKRHSLGCKEGAVSLAVPFAPRHPCCRLGR